MKYLFIFLLISTSAIADCLQLDANTPHYTVAGLNGSCDVAMTADEISAKEAADAAANAAAAAAEAHTAIKASAASAIAAGIAITSTATPSLNGTYDLDQTSQNQVSATTTYILLNGTFPGGGTTMPWVDQNGSAHVWPNVAEFKAFATVYANYVAAVSLYAASNGASGALPSNSVTIP